MEVSKQAIVLKLQRGFAKITKNAFVKEDLARLCIGKL